ncbi:hypothetical protein [Streptomyces lydicus]|uniref:hypothetical protein n=1 Tax=Streptomyces lydicus TaxID=47763 RepID=UPI00240D53AF|nr:hypothetical protein [Streptomyces lydicus]
MDDAAAAAGFQLASQIADEGVDGVGPYVEVVAPDPFQELVAGQDLTGVGGPATSSSANFAPVRDSSRSSRRARWAAASKQQAADAHRVGGGGRAAAQQCVQTQYQLVEGERLDE